MNDYSTWRCPNEHCRHFGQPNHGQIRLAGWSGKGKRIRMLRCGTCGRAFSERTWTPHFNSRLSQEEDMRILETYVKGHSIRAVSRMTGISRPAIRRRIKYAQKLMGMHQLYEERRETQEQLDNALVRLGLVSEIDSNVGADREQRTSGRDGGANATSQADTRTPASAAEKSTSNSQSSPRTHST